MRRTSSRKQAGGTGATSGLIIMRFPKDLRRHIKIQALEDNVLMGDWMIAALWGAVEQAERKRG